MSEFKINSGLKKNKKIHIKLPADKFEALRAKVKGTKLKGMQYFFDAVIVGGVVMRRPEAIELIRKYKQKYKDIFVQQSLARLGKVEKPQIPKQHTIACFLYSQDYKALSDFTIEENIKRQWIFNCLFIDAFLENDEPAIYSLIDRHIALDIGKRKAAVARLANDKFIHTLDEVDAEAILDQMTKEYDNKKFDASLEELIKFSIQAKNKNLEKNEEAEEDEAFMNKIRSLEVSQAASITQIIKPKQDID